jgi:hypothetical protein
VAGNASALGGLASAIDMIPKLQEKKRRIDVHTNLATAILKEVKVCIVCSALLSPMLSPVFQFALSYYIVMLSSIRDC